MIPRARERRLDLVGIGIGPANLGLAALLRPVPGTSSRFLEQKPEFRWHPGLLFDDSRMQVHFLKDLVTLVDPTSPYSFLAFLVAKGRLYRALITDRPRASRKEFEEYYSWVADQLPNLSFSSTVEEVDWAGDHFVVRAGGPPLRSRHLVVGTGHRPYVPQSARPFLGERVFHASEFLLAERSFAGQTVAVIGGGQTGAEIFYRLLQRPDRPRRVLWVTPRPNFLPLDDSAFTNELFLPGYSRFFHGLPRERREELLAGQKLASDGIDEELLLAIYRRLYDLEFLERAGRGYELLPGHKLVGVERDGGAFAVALRGAEPGGEQRLRVDTMILATGYRPELPSALAPLLPRLTLENGLPPVRSDFSLEWDGPSEHRIYLQNGARHSFGIADPNLSLMAWRNATIINSIAGRTVYDVDGASAAIHWTASAAEGDAADSDDIAA